MIVSLLVNVAGVVLYLQRSGKRAPRPDIYRQDREAMFEVLAGTSTPDVVMFGDSLTDRGEWPELLKNARVVNRGIAGDTIAAARTRVAALAPLRPKTIAVMLGINDLLGGASVADCIAHYTELLAALKQGDPAPRIVVQSVLPVRAPISLSNDVIRQLNAQLRELCAARGCEFLDAHAAFGGSDGALDASLTTDGVHLNGRGYTRWAAQLGTLR
ncbi:MAG TPA: GDSL-type esterase/lipase family protein [Kofleriaceae bacterium]